MLWLVPCVPGSAWAGLLDFRPPAARTPRSRTLFASARDSDLPGLWERGPRGKGSVLETAPKIFLEFFPATAGHSPPETPDRLRSGAGLVISERDAVVTFEVKV
jgi:hypothetical protein